MIRLLRLLISSGSGPEAWRVVCGLCVMAMITAFSCCVLAEEPAARGAAAAAPDAPEPAHAFLDNGVTAHRGNSGQHPENTMPAFKSGLEVGADWIELDVFRTSDGKLVVIHDRTTGRVGDLDMDVTQRRCQLVVRCERKLFGSQWFRSRMSLGKRGLRSGRA